MIFVSVSFWADPWTAHPESLACLCGRAGPTRAEPVRLVEAAAPGLLARSCWGMALLTRC
jgi:hypothetical protein